MLRTLFFLAILIPGLVAAFTNRFAALLLYVWFALFRPQEWVWFDLSSLRLSLVIGLLAVLPPLLMGPWPNLTHPVSICTIGFIVGGALAQIDAFRPDIGWQWLDYMVRLGLVCLLVPSLANSRKRFLTLMTVMAGSFGFFTTKAGLASLLGGGLRFSDGLAGSFADNNGYAVGTVMILPLLLAVAQNDPRRWVRVGFLVSVPLSVLTVISTFSRAGFVSLIACAATLILLQKRRLLIAAVALPLVVVGAMLAPIPQGYGDRLQTISTYKEVGETSALSRLYFWNMALQMVVDHPLGIGLRNFEAAYDAYDRSDGEYGSARAVHNSHLQALVEAGVVGGLFYAGLILFALRAAFRARRRARDETLADTDRRFLLTSANATIASIVGFLVGGTFISMAFNELLWLVAAMAATLELLARNMEPATVEETMAAPVGTAGQFALKPVTA